MDDVVTAAILQTAESGPRIVISEDRIGGAGGTPVGRIEFFADLVDEIAGFIKARAESGFPSIGVHSGTTPDKPTPASMLLISGDAAGQEIDWPKISYGYGVETRHLFAGKLSIAPPPGTHSYDVPLVQRGKTQVSTNASGEATIDFPQEFPAGAEPVVTANCTVGGRGCTIRSVNQFGFTVQVWHWNNGLAANAGDTIRWIAAL